MSAFDLTINTNGDHELKWVRGRNGGFVLSGEFGGGTAAFFWKSPAGHWIPFRKPDGSGDDFTLTADGGLAFEYLPAIEIRVSLSGATDPLLVFSLT